MQDVVPITEEIFQIGGGTLSAPEDAAVYLVRFGRHAALIDAGCGRATLRLLHNIAAAGAALEEVGHLLITHCHFDHTGGAAALRQRLGCEVVMHADDAPFLEAGDDVVTAASWYGSRLTPCPVDRRIEGDRAEVALGEGTITAVHIPGHSPGSVAYLVRSGGLSVVFAQDVHGPLHPSLLSDEGLYQASLQRLLDLDADVLCEGHCGVFRGRDSIGRFVRSFMR